MEELNIGRKDIRDAVVAELSPLLRTEHTSKREEVQRRMGTTNGLVLDMLVSLIKGNQTSEPVISVFPNLYGAAVFP